MTRELFKLRMQNLKSYRESNPGKGYWEWRNSLPNNLKHTDDNVYDMLAAYLANDKARDYFSGKTEAPGAEDFEFPVNGDNLMDADELAQHELNHYTDFIISRNPNTTYNNAMLTLLENSLKRKGPGSSDYYRKGTELKAYMNQLRRKMYKEKIISTIDEPVSEYKLKKYISKLPESNSIKKAFNEHKSLSAYTRWFNSIPLLGLSPLVISNMREEDK